MPPRPGCLSLYVALADEQGVDRGKLTGTVQNDIMKEYLSRGTYVFPPAPSLRLIKDVIVYAAREMPKWNPTNVCSYHLQEAGATPAQELAFALATAEAVLDEVRNSGEVSAEEFPQVARPHLLLRQCRRALHHRGVQDARLRRSLGRDRREALRRHRSGAPALPLRRAGEFARAHRAAAREQRLSHPALDARGDAVEEGARPRRAAPGLERGARPAARPGTSNGRSGSSRSSPTRPTFSSYGDIFDGSAEIDRKVEELKEEARAELAKLQAMGGAVAAIDYMKEALIASNAARVEAIEKGEQVLVGVNAYTETEPSPLSAGGTEGIMTVPESVEIEQVAALQAWRQRRDDKAVRQALIDLKSAAAEGRNIMEPSIAAAKAGVTTGEWGEVLREVFGEYRAPTGIHAKHHDRHGEARRGAPAVDEVSGKLGRTLTFVVGKPGLDGHSNGAEQIAVRATDVGMEVVYDGIRLTPGADRRAGEARRGPMWSGCRSSPARMCRSCARWAAPARGGHGRGADRGRRHHPGRGRERAEAMRRVGHLHAEGLPAQRHHARHREAGRRQG